MPVNEIKLNPEQKAINSAAQESREDAFAAKLVESFDLPSNLAANIETAIKEEKNPKEEERQEEEQAEELETASETETETDQEESEESSEESEEDLIPKSKVQKRMDELTREKKMLEARLKKLEAAQESKPKKDADLERLEAMNDAELKTLKKQVKLEQMDAVNKQEKDRLNQLMELEDKIEATMSSAPKRFSDRQISNFNDAVRETAESGEIRDFNKAYPQIFKYAESIYKSSPELQGSVTGQARAWEFASQHYIELSKVSEGKSKTQELERKVNTMKKKISLDSGTQKQGVQKEADDARKIFQKAKHGTEDDKLNFFKKSVIAQEMYRNENY